ncbi:hypothetical protein [Rubrivirga marina]|uniref:hypothetical protein n=1 Tax=Rubrivirga marina TaxID=1196024 RepID=UPI0015C8162B|nr:hypothetical protein [Rubrivirga marina]
MRFPLLLFAALLVLAGCGSAEELAVELTRSEFTDGATDTGTVDATCDDLGL